MAVIKQGPRPEDHYTLIPNSLSRNPDIPPRAKAVYLYLRSVEDGGKEDSRSISSALGVGRDIVACALRDLEKFGYLTRSQRMVNGQAFGEAVYEILSTSIGGAS